MPLFNKDYEKEIASLKAEIVEYKRNTSGLVLLQITVTNLRQENESLKSKVQEYENQIKKLTAKINVFENPIHNERGAGRKSKATDENVAEISRLRTEGYSYSQIANILTENSGEYISKSTVAKIAKSVEKLSPATT
jgi:predicted RNase H-like nuclease (RuvC/YqgF family)